MQELWQEIYPEEELLNFREENDFSLRLDMSKFQEILGRETWPQLQKVFERQHYSLSQSFLIWSYGSGQQGQQWILVDFGNEKTYYIETLSETGTGVTNEERPPQVEFTEFEDISVRLKKAPRTICKLLAGPQGTRLGFLALIMKLDLGEVDLEGLKRTGLKESKLDFESVHQDLVVVHGLFREILTSSRTDHTTLSDSAVQAIRSYLPTFYDIEGEIKELDASGERPMEKHADLLQKISNFYRDARSALDPIITYVRSTQMGEYQTKFNDFFDNAESKWKKFDAESEAKLQKLEDLRIARENQIATTSISDHVKFFEKQAEEHEDNARRWFWGTIGMAIVFIFIGIVLLFFTPKSNEWAAILPNFFTKGS